MKQRHSELIICVWTMLLATTAQHVLAQTPSIQSFGRNGELVGIGLQPGTSATVEWAPTVEGPWSSSWAALKAVAADDEGTIRVSVPMLYRLRVGGVPSNPNPERLAWIPPGTFLMGSPESEAERNSDETQHEVTISRGFWMGRFEVTQGEYMEVMGTNPSYHRNGVPLVYPGAAGPATNDVLQPVESVSWYAAISYCAFLTDRERKAGRLPEGYEYRLPTESEWEYACRAGTTTAFHYGDELRSGEANFRGTKEYAASVGTIENPDGIYLGRPVACGSYLPNAWGLYDMHGNVFEWCQDWYGSYPTAPTTDPMGPALGTDRVTRGSDFSRRGWFSRAAYRHHVIPSAGGDATGFRVVLAPTQP